MTGESILIVEDDSLVTRVIDNRLRLLGYRVAGIASSGEEALDQVKATQPNLILMDIRLEGEMDGVQVADQVRAKWDIPVIFLTAYADPDTLQRAKMTGPFGYLVKPIETEVLRNTIEMALYKHAIDKQLKASETRYRAIVEDQTEFINRTQVDGIIEFVNDAYCKLFNKTRQELIGARHADFLNPDELEQLKNTWSKLTPENPHIMQDYRFVKPDGEVVWLQWSDRLICDEHGKPIEYQGVGRDVTNLKFAEEALRKANDELSKYVDTLQQYNRQVTQLNEMGNLLQSCLTVDDAYAVVGEYSEKLFPGHCGALYVLNEEHERYEGVSTWGVTPPVESVVTAKTCWALRRNQVHMVEAPNTRLHCRHADHQQSDAGFRPYICIPMIVQGETIGLFYLIGSSGEAIADWRLLGINVAERAAWTILNLKLREKLREQSIRDPLTNLFNRRHMEEALELEISRASRHQRSFVMVMMDLDYLKSFNDSYGHDAGDALLQEFARFLQSNVRKEDIACRYGGDEFVIIMPEAHLEDAIPRVETLRKGGHNLPLDFHGQLLPGITVTLGVACFPEHGKTAVELFKAADAALYSAKAKGRNQMMVAEDDRKQKL